MSTNSSPCPAEIRLQEWKKLTKARIIARYMILGHSDQHVKQKFGINGIEVNDHLTVLASSDDPSDINLHKTAIAVCSQYQNKRQTSLNYSIEYANYMVENNCSASVAAKHFNVSVSTIIHRINDLQNRSNNDLRALGNKALSINRTQKKS